jgi:anti-sigma regulatory factor (Ser/Thr protein kinase)
LAEATPVRVLDIRLAAEANSVPAARRALDPLAPLMVPERLDDARLLVSELVTNSLRHGALLPSDEVQLTADVKEGKVRIRVLDPGRGFALGVRPPSPGSQGLGLYLLSQLADAWSITVDGVTSIWFDVATR